MTETVRKKKLIEVALPLDEINAACKADKDRKTGTIRNLHKWFAPMPLPAWRALLFAALIDDPDDDSKRVYLLDVIKRLVSSGADLPDDRTIQEARELLAKQFPDGLPLVMDPFCGGGSTLIEAQRLGMSTFGADLNPVPVLISRVATQILPSVANMPGLHHGAEGSDAPTITLIPAESGRARSAFAGLAEDVRYYARTIEAEVSRALAHHYPAQPGETPIAWIWARTVQCPNPTCGIETILTTSWWLSKKKRDFAWIEPSVKNGEVRLQVRQEPIAGQVAAPPKSARGASFVCVACANVISETEIATRATQGGLGLRLVAVVAERQGHRIYREATSSESSAAKVDLSLDPPMSLRRVASAWWARRDRLRAGVSSGRLIPVVHFVLGRAVVAAVVSSRWLAVARGLP